MRNCIYRLLIVFIALNWSCKKSETSGLITPYSKVKLFEDSLAYPSTGTDRIVAGNNRLFMIYYHWDGVSASHSINYLVTDNDANMIRYDSLPAGSYVNALISLSDETFVVVASNLANTPHLLHYSGDGEFISDNSPQLPGATQLSSASRSHSGNILISSTDNAGSNYLLECNANGDVLWSHQTSIPVDANFPTVDGGYLFSSYYGNGGYFSVMKTNGTGDSLWQKTFYTPYYSYCYWMASLRNGHFIVCVNDLTVWQHNSNIPPPLTIYELNESGDSIRASTLSEIDYNFQGPVLEREDGSTFILMTPYLFGFGIAIPELVNTNYVILDEDMNITEHGALQDHANDFFDSACKTSDGRIACFGVIQGYHRYHYKPALIILN